MKEYAKNLKCTYEQILFSDVPEQKLLDIYRWFQIAPQEQYVGDPSEYKFCFIICILNDVAEALRDIFPSMKPFNIWVGRHHFLKKQEA